MILRYRDMEKWLWQKGMATRKQRPAVVRYRKPKTARNFFLLGVLLGYVPYMFHQGWIL
jgi:hypothetical protein